jgi:hypothetical protein
MVSVSVVTSDSVSVACRLSCVACSGLILFRYYSCGYSCGYTDLFIFICSALLLCSALLCYVRYKNGRKAEWASPPLSMAVSSSRVSNFNPEDCSSTVAEAAAEDPARAAHLPMLCSHCPGEQVYCAVLCCVVLCCTVYCII